MKHGSGFSEISDHYEAWRGKRIALIADDVTAKYARMAESPWLLARGGYHRFVTQFPVLLPELADTPLAVSTGDLHLEKFGTWRDRAGRLVWGVTGLEEVDLLPYAADLVRLASGVLLAVDAGLLEIDPRAGVAAILAGWSTRIAARSPTPFVLGADHAELYALHRRQLRDPISFEADIDALAPFERALPKAAARMLASVTPPGDYRPRLRRAPAGFTSLGARRIVAVGELDGGRLVREIQQVPGPASMWAEPKRMQLAGLAAAIDAGRGVAAEPWRRQSRKWIVRGLDGSLSGVELPLPVADIAAVLTKMGAEAANIQLTAAAEAAPRKAIRRDAAERPPDWLFDAAMTMAHSARADHADFAALVEERGIGSAAPRASVAGDAEV